MKLLLTDISLRRPWLIVALTLIATLVFAWQFPKVRFDNDPENMLAAYFTIRSRKSMPFMILSLSVWSMRIMPMAFSMLKRSTGLTD